MIVDGAHLPITIGEEVERTGEEPSFAVLQVWSTPPPVAAVSEERPPSSVAAEGLGVIRRTSGPLSQKPID